MLAGRLELEFDTSKSLDVAPLRRSIARRFLRITRALAKMEGMCSQEGSNSSLTQQNRSTSPRCGEAKHIRFISFV